MEIIGRCVGSRHPYSPGGHHGTRLEAYPNVRSDTTQRLVGANWPVAAQYLRQFEPRRARDNTGLHVRAFRAAARTDRRSRTEQRLHLFDRRPYTGQRTRFSASGRRRDEANTTGQGLRQSG